MEFDRLKRIYGKWLDFSHDPDLLLMLYGGIVANRFHGNPVWIVFQGPSGCGKTTLLESIKEARDLVYTVSSLTPTALASGLDKEQKESLLFKLDGKILVIKDISAVTEMHPEQRGFLFAMLRDAYDGSLVRATGRNEIRWEGKFGLMAGATPAFEHARKMDSMLGERFLTIRIRTRGTKDVLDAELRSSARKSEMNAEIRTAAAEFLKTLLPRLKPDAQRSVHRSTHDLIRACVQSLVKVRSSIIRDSRSREIEFPAEVTEIPTRIFNQLMLICFGMRVIGADEADMNRIVLRLFLDSIPYTRLKYLRAIANGCERQTDIARSVGVSLSFIPKVLEDLRVLGVVEEEFMSRKVKIIDEVLLRALKEDG